MDETWGQVFLCILYGTGIIGMLLVYGVIQERVMSMPYDGEMFKISVFLVLCNRLVGIVYACGMTGLKGERFAPKAPLWKYIAISFSNVAATTCQYEALKWVSFPVQMLGKSFKMMPVMIWSMTLSGKRYKLTDWAIAAGVTWGVVQFLLTGDIKSKHGDSGTSVYGLFLMLGFLGCDGFTSTFQEKVFKDCKTTKYNQMMYVNSASALVSFGSLLLSGALPTAIGFCFRHPSFVTHAMTLSAASVGGQFFIYSQVKEFGALVLAATMNLRQVISILMSFLLYGHSITLLQVGGLVLVFGSLFYKSYIGFKNSKKQAKNPKAAAVPTKDLEENSNTLEEPKIAAPPTAEVAGINGTPPEELGKITVQETAAPGGATGGA